jgi:hypothetical protein
VTIMANYKKIQAGGAPIAANMPTVLVEMEWRFSSQRNLHAFRLSHFARKLRLTIMHRSFGSRMKGMPMTRSNGRPFQHLTCSMKLSNFANAVSRAASKNNTDKLKSEAAAVEKACICGPSLMQARQALEEWAAFEHRLACASHLRPANSHRHGAKPLRSAMAPRLGPWLQPCMMEKAARL